MCSSDLSAQRQLTPGLAGRGQRGGRRAPRPQAFCPAPAVVFAPVGDVGGADPLQDDALVALKPGGGHIDPAIVGVVVPRPALRMAVVHSGGELCIQVPPGDTAVIGAPDLGPHDVAEAAVDDCVQVERVTHPQQVGRNDGADAAARPTLGAGAVNLAPKLLREVGIGAAGAAVTDRVVGIAAADQDHW